MTVTEIMVIGGGLLLGYWLVSVLVPTLFGGKNGKGPASEGSPPHESNNHANDYGNFESEEPLHREESATPHSNSLRWFEVLEVDEGASAMQIEAAYKRQISQYHPDKVARMGIEIRQLAESRSKAINAAYHAATKR